MSAEQALEEFAGDGATCEVTTCLGAEQFREPLSYLYFPSIRQPGPRRTWDYFRQVTVKAAVIAKPTDIVVQRWSHSVTMPE